MANSTFDLHDTYPLRLNSRESKLATTVVSVSVEQANGATKVANAAERLALPPSDGNLVVQLDNHTLYIYNAGTSSWIAVTGGGGSGTPGGDDGQVQFNNGGTFDADSKFAWDNTNKQLNLNGFKIESLGSETLLNNQTSVTLMSFTHAVEKFIVVEYSIERGSDVRLGHLKLATNGVTASLDDIFVNTDDVGVTFSAVVSGLSVEIKYSTTNLGTSATMKYSRRKWI
jgi:hypothetical protein